MSNRKILDLFDNDYLFMENLRLAKKENFSNFPKNDITFSKTQFTKTSYETDTFEEDFDNSSHLKYQHINNYKPLNAKQRLNAKNLSMAAYKTSLNEVYN
tara:strand:- start:554 stop:853 length:300 start_codon:yes stop_codon:yes gene_type:complete